MPPVVSTMRIRQNSLLLVGLLPLLAVPAPLAAQTCVTSGADLKCSNAGSIVVIDAANNNDPGTTEAVNSGNIDQYLSAITNGNGVTVVSNSGRVGQGLYAATFGSGNGTTVATNSGSIAGDLTAETTGNGTTAVLNSGAISQYLLASTNGDGVTSVRNTGDIGGELRAEVLGNGTTTVVNSGPVGSNLSANTHGNGTTSVTNSGSVGSFIFANTGGNGNTTVTNSGRVADYVEVYVIADGNATLINTGSVGSYLSATVSNGSTTVVNSGTVGGGLYTAVFGGGDVSVSNSGSIGEDLTATTNNYGSVIVKNTGRIGWYLMAVNYGDGTTTVANSGSIWRGAQVSTQGTGSSNLVNSGFITNTTGPLAIDMSGSNPTLTLLPGSIIIGGISLGGTNSAVAMNTGNQNLTFTSLAGVSVSGNVPFVVSGDRIVSVDPTGFAMQGRALTDFTREVTASIPQTAAPAATGGAPLAFASSDAPSRIADAFAALPGLAASANDAIAFRNGTVIGADGSTMWGRSFAGQRIQPADGAMVRAQNLFYGGMIGGDTGAGSNLRLGGFFRHGHQPNVPRPQLRLQPQRHRVRRRLCQLRRRPDIRARGPASRRLEKHQHPHGQQQFAGTGSRQRLLRRLVCQSRRDNRTARRAGSPGRRQLHADARTSPSLSLRHLSGLHRNRHDSTSDRGHPHRQRAGGARRVETEADSDIWQ